MRLLKRFLAGGAMLLISANAAYVTVAQPTNLTLEFTGSGKSFTVAVEPGKQAVIDQRDCRKIVSRIQADKPVTKEHCTGPSGSVSYFNEHFVGLEFQDVRLIEMASQTVAGIRIDLPHTADQSISTYVKLPPVGGKVEFMTGWSITRKQ